MTHRVLLLACLLMALSTAGHGQEAGRVGGPSVETSQEVADQGVHPNAQQRQSKSPSQEKRNEYPADQEGARDQRVRPVELIPLVQADRNSAKAHQDNEDHEGGDQEQERDVRDLHAQESMAQSAHWMAVISGLSLLFTIVALIYIRLTFKQTQRAADYTAGMLREARLTTEAAKKQIDVTQRIAEIQTRAFLVIDKANLIYMSGTPVLDLELTNCGNSPARNVRAIFVCRCETVTIGNSLRSPYKITPKVQFIKTAIVAKGSEKHRVQLSGAGVYTRHGERKVALIQMIEMILEYQTEFDVQRSTVDREISVVLTRAADGEDLRIIQKEPGANQSPEFRLFVLDPHPADTWMDWYRRERGNEPGNTDPAS